MEVARHGEADYISCNNGTQGKIVVYSTEFQRIVKIAELG